MNVRYLLQVCKGWPKKGMFSYPLKVMTAKLKVYKAKRQGFHNVTDFCGKDDTALVSEVYF